MARPGLGFIMKQKQIEQGRISEHGRGVGTATLETMRNRAREIAVINGRASHVLDSDYEQAQRELLGEEEALKRLPTLGENLREDQRWDLTPGSSGYKMRTLDAPDEQTVVERLIEEGMAEAEHDRHLTALRES